MDKNKTSSSIDKLVFLDVEASDQNTFFQIIADRLFHLGYVKETFYQGLAEREAHYPTGLPSVPYAVAIPHCDPVNVVKEGMAIVRFKDPIIFREMGTEDKTQSCKFAFVLMIKGVHEVSILSSLMKIFNNKDLMEQMISGNEAEIANIFQKV
ncbi:PTS system galactitol-specific EIIA component [bioreactor metagenome]|uniref:PTS system galactitol-specific EIIA component n=1 Tax=bioreactor metagenome TaxID=1076179 RepID=A0A645E4R2_9ZZZZ